MPLRRGPFNWWGDNSFVEKMFPGSGGTGRSGVTPSGTPNNDILWRRSTTPPATTTTRAAPQQRGFVPPQQTFTPPNYATPPRTQAELGMFNINGFRFGIPTGATFGNTEPHKPFTIENPNTAYWPLQQGAGARRTLDTFIAEAQRRAQTLPVGRSQWSTEGAGQSFQTAPGYGTLGVPSWPTTGYPNPNAPATPSTAPRGARNQEYYQERPPASAGPFAASDDAATRTASIYANQRGAGSTSGGSGSLPSGVAPRVPKVQFNTAAFEKLRKQALADSLAAISANYGYQEEQAEAAMGDLTAQFEKLMLENQQAGRASTISLEGHAAERGLGHSGIYAQVRAQAASQLAAQRAEIIGTYSTKAGEYGTMARDIESQRKLLKQQQALEVSQAKTASLRQKLELEQMQALANAGMSV